MSHGKEDAQVGHAANAFICNRMMVRMEFGKLRCEFDLSEAETRWLTGELKTKIILQVEDEHQLLQVAQEAKDAGLETHLIRDAGLTVFHGVPTHTCLVIGPDFIEKISPITNKLKLRS